MCTPAKHSQTSREKSQTSSSVRVDLDTALLVLEQGLQYKLNPYSLLDVLYDVPSLTRTELGHASVLPIHTLQTLIRSI